MRIVKVTYTTKANYAEQNKANITKVMSDLQKMNVSDLRYDAFVGPDGRSFTHLALAYTDAAQKILNELESFKSFQQQLKASGPETPPVQELFTLVGSSYKN